VFFNKLVNNSRIQTFSLISFRKQNKSFLVSKRRCPIKVNEKEAIKMKYSIKIVIWFCKRQKTMSKIQLFFSSKSVFGQLL
jgi:hypothetical protein